MQCDARRAGLLKHREFDVPTLQKRLNISDRARLLASELCSDNNSTMISSRVWHTWLLGKARMERPLWLKSS